MGDMIIPLLEETILIIKLIKIIDIDLLSLGISFKYTVITDRD